MGGGVSILLPNNYIDGLKKKHIKNLGTSMSISIHGEGEKEKYF